LECISHAATEGRLIANDDLGRIWKLRYYTRIYLERLRKPIKGALRIASLWTEN
jgi:hypothetical protein